MTSAPVFVEGVDIRALPKVSLHDHLDGAVRPATIIELAKEAGIRVPVTTSLRQAQHGASGSVTPESLAEWFRTSCNGGSLVDYLTTFGLTTSVMQTRHGLTRIAREFVEDLAADGVVYGEVRWAPEQHLTGELSLDEAVDAVQDGIDQAEQALGGSIRVRQLLCAMRHNDNAREIAELAVQLRDRGVVGFDIAGPEDGFPPSAHREAFDYLADHFMPVTVHAGEDAGLDSIASALHDGRALRLGHGIRIADDIELIDSDDDELHVSLGPLARWVRDRQIPLEVSPSSNVQTSGFASMAEHPFDLLYQLGFNVTVNPDNRLQSQTSITQDLGLLADAFGYDLDDLAQFQRNAAAAAFLPVAERDALVAQIDEAWDEARTARG